MSHPPTPIRRHLFDIATAPDPRTAQAAITRLRVALDNAGIVNTDLGIDDAGINGVAIVATMVGAVIYGISAPGSGGVNTEIGNAIAAADIAIEALRADGGNAVLATNAVVAAIRIVVKLCVAIKPGTAAADADAAAADAATTVRITLRRCRCRHWCLHHTSP